jgi:uncharacterized protein YdaU (DUF1376 family)
MARQPYIPVYIGDWEQDVNGLSIAAEGAWLKIVFKCWRNEGSFTATIDILARVCKVTPENFACILLEWKMNNLCDITDHGDGVITLSSRRLKRELAKSAVKAVSGSIGGKSAQAKIKQNKNSAQANSDIDNDNVNDSVIEVKEGVQGKPSGIEEKLSVALSEGYLDPERPKWPHLDFDFELETFKNKVRGSPHEYQGRDTGGIRLAFQYQLRTSKGKVNGKQTGKDKSTEHLSGLVQGYKQRRNKSA